MCGIVGYLGNTPFHEFVLTGLSLLQNRGYDSVGICTIHNGKLSTIKHASNQTNDSLKHLERDILQNTDISSCNIGMGHTRWATHGAKTQMNAHPHHDMTNTIAVVHNGIIENFQELKRELVQEGYTFRSHTDTEVIAILLGKHWAESTNRSMEQVIQRTLERLSGTWALVILHREFPNRMWITRNGSPLLLGIDDDFVLVVSEQIAFGNNIQKYLVLDNHDLIEISRMGSQIFYTTNIMSQYELKEKTNVHVEYTPVNYKHWMIKEIFEQPDAVHRALNNGGRISIQNKVILGGLDSNRHSLIELDHLILLGCGTSYHSGLWAMDIFKTLDIFDTISIYDGAEFVKKDIPKKGKTGLVLLSQSGETKDLHRCIKIAKECNLVTIGVVNMVDSLIARETDCGVYLNAGREVAVASTKSFTNQCIVLTLIAIWFSQQRNSTHQMQKKREKIIQDLHNLAFHIQQVLDQASIVDLVSMRIVQEQLPSSMFLLGKGQNEAIAKEGALKLKEVAYIHAEGYSSSALKHGPFALITPGLPIVLIDVNDEYRDKIQNTFQEVSAREAMVLRISNHYDGNFIIDNNATFGGILVNVYLQLLSYFLAIHQDYNPDFPRNLAKVVTVE